MAKKILKLLMGMLLSVFTVIGISKGSSVYADDSVIAEGTYGCPWVITGDGTLVIGEEGQDCTLSNKSSMQVSSWPWYSYRTQITSAETKGIVHSAAGSLFGMFNGQANNTSIDLTGFDTSSGTSFYNMFYGCSKLASLNLGDEFDTSKGISFYNMFYGCSKLTSLDLGDKFDTSNGTTFGAMFYDCSGLTSLDLGDKFDTSNSGSFDSMFQNCSSLTTLNLGDKFNTSNGNNFYRMFYYCSSLPLLDLGDKFDTSKGTNFSEMFDHCSSLTSIDLGDKFDTSKGTNFSSMFLNCYELTSLNFGDKFNTANGTNFSNMFNSCSKLEKLDLSLFNTAKATSISSMFYNMTSLKSIILPATFTFNGDGTITGTRALLPTPSAPSTKWMRTYDLNTMSMLKGDNRDLLTATELRDTWDGSTMAGLWIWDQVDPSSMGYGDETKQYSVDGKWTQLSEDTWQYIFEVFDDQLQYYLTEDIIEGFHSDIDPDTGYVTIQDKTGEITNITNTELGSLTVRKNVVETTAGEHPVRGPFNIQVTLAGTGIPEDGKKIIDGVVFTNGTAIISLGAGESKTFNNLPEGVTYNVAELDKPANCITSYADQSGIIRKEGNTAVVTNTYTESESEGPRVKIVFAKHTLNAPESVADNEYSFLLNVKNMDASYEYTMQNTNGSFNTFVTDDDGCANVPFKVKANEQITIEDIPVGAQYQFVESPGDWYASYEIKNEDSCGSVVRNSDSNSEMDTGLSTAYETAEEDEVSTVTFTNIYENSQRLRITKNVTDDPNDTTKFAFTVHFSNMEEGLSFDSSIGRVIADDEGNAEKEFYLAAGDVVEFEGIPAGVNYQITEDKSSLYVASYEIIDESGEYEPARIAKDSDANTTKNKELSTKIETVDIAEDVLVRFSNSKETGSLTVSKTGTDDISETEEFDIQITLTGDRFGVSGTFSCTGLDEDSITFDKNGQAVIKIKKGDSVTISGLPVGANYTVEELDPDGLYKKTYTDRTGTIPAGNATATINNAILSDSDISISKTVTGNMGSRDKEFTFSISMQDGDNPVAGDFVAEGTDATHVTFNSSGIATFTLSHGQTITIKDVPIGATYTVTENDYGSEGYITTSNNSSGTIAEDPDDNNVAFTNQNGSAMPTGIYAVLDTMALITAAAILAFAIFGLMKTKHEKEA